METKKKYHILLVDDEESVRFTLDKYLTDAGYKVNTASGLSEAYSHLKIDSFNVAIIDRMLTNGENGMDLVHYIGKRKPACRAIMISAYPSTESEKEAGQYGAFLYLVKPVRKKDILFAVAVAADSEVQHEPVHRRKDSPLVVYAPVRRRRYMPMLSENQNRKIDPTVNAARKASNE